jgi:hypothetical protein
MLNIPIIHLYNTILPIMQEVESSLKLKKSKSGRKPKLSNAQIATLFIISYLTNCPVMRLAQLLIDPNIKSYHIFRKVRIKAVYKLLRTYMQLKAIAIIALKLLIRKRVKLIVDGSLMPVASLNRARTQKIRRLAGSFIARITGKKLSLKKYAMEC